MREKFPPDPFYTDPLVAGGRVGTESGVSRSVTDQLAKTDLFYTPDIHNQISLFDGTHWLSYNFAELVHGVPVVADTNHDVFVFLSNSTTLELDLVAWTNDTTRAVALATQDGRKIKSGSTTHLYVGSFRTSAVAGEIEDSDANPNIYNHYNQTWRDRYIVEAASGARAVSDFASGVVTQAIAEAGTSKAPFAWTAERVRQSIEASTIKGDVATTDATVTNLLTIPIPDDTAVSVRFRIVAFRTNGANQSTYEGVALFSRRSAAAAIDDGFTETVGIGTIGGAAGSSSAVSGNNGLIQVKGRASRNINWHGEAVLVQET